MKHVAGDLQSDLTKHNLRCVATVKESPRATDFAVALSRTCLVVVRQVERATREDHLTLATMISQGDFVWAGLVYSDQAGTDWPGGVETFHLSDISRLIERLQQFKTPAAS